MIQANRLTEHITIEQLTISASTYGEQIQSWNCIYKGYFSIMNDAGNKTFSGGDNYFSTITFYGRYIPHLQRKGIRVKYNDEVYQIEEIVNVQRNRAIIIKCTNAK